MPIQTTFGSFISGDVIAASDVNTRVQLVEEFVNTDITSFDVAENRWMQHHHVPRPEFFGSPAPRVKLMTSDVHFRSLHGGADSLLYHEQLCADRWEVIPGLAMTFHVSNTHKGKGHGENIGDGDIQTVRKGHKVLATVCCNFFVRPEQHRYEAASFGEAATDFDTPAQRIAVFSLHVNGTAIPGTKRYTYAGTSRNSPYSYKNHSIIAPVELNVGTNDISVRIKLDPTQYPDGEYRGLYVKARYINTEVYYL